MIKKILLVFLLLTVCASYATFYCPSSITCDNPHKPLTCIINGLLPPSVKNIKITTDANYQGGTYYFVEAGGTSFTGAVCTYSIPSKVSNETLTIPHVTNDKTVRNSEWYLSFTTPASNKVYLCYSHNPQDCPLAISLTPIKTKE